MKRSFAWITGALLLVQLLTPSSFAATSLSAPITYDGPHGSSYFADAVVTSSNLGYNRDKTDEAEDDTTNDVTFEKETDSALYIGFDAPFDGVALDVGSSAGKNATWTLEYWNGSDWVDIKESTEEITNDSNGSYSYSWDSRDFDDWDTNSLLIHTDLTTTGNLYFVRFYLNNSSYTEDILIDQIGVLKYNFQVIAQDELNNSLTGYDAEDLLTLENGDTTVHGAMEDNGDYFYALHAETALSNSYTYSYIFGIDGYVSKSGSISIVKTGNSDVDAELDFAHKVTAVNEAGNTLSINAAEVNSDSCTISSGKAYCAVSPGDLATATLEVEGYVSNTGHLINRTSDDEAQVETETEMDYAYKVTLTEDGSSSTISGATVTMGDDLDITCDDLGSGKYGCAVPADQTDGAIKISASGYSSMSDTLSSSEIRDATDDDQVELSYELSTTDANGPDFVVNNIYMSGDNLMINVGNDGDEDVNETVKIKIYIDGDLEETLSSSSANWLDAGGSTVYNLGNDIYGDETDFEVEVCMDTSEDVDETDEDNNCETEDISINDDNEPDLTVDNLDIQDDGDITFTVMNDGDADVNDDERVYIYVYVDGDKDWSRSYEIGDDEGSWLEEGTERDINVGTLFDDEDEHTVRVCVDAKDEIDESDEGNNCTSKDLQVGEDPGEAYYCNVFIDMTGHWAADAVCELADRGIVSGRTYDRYEPNEDVTRAEFLKIILLNAGYDVSSNSSYYYYDVPTYHWSYKYVTYASSLGIVHGYSDGSFHPDSPITRGEAIVMIMRLYGEELWGYDSSDIDYSDVYTWDWYAYAVILADNYGIVHGYSDGRFLPNNYLDRAEAAVIAVRTYDALD